MGLGTIVKLVSLGAVMFDSHALRQLGDYAVALLAAATRAEPLSAEMTDQWATYHQVLGVRGAARRATAPIYADIGAGVGTATLPRTPLTLAAQALFPGPAASAPGEPNEWSGALATVEQVVATFATVPDDLAPYAFEPLHAAMQRFGTNLPATFTDQSQSLSLFRQFTLVAALFAASGGSAPAERFLLVASDTPGIQRFLIASTQGKGVAKGLRGRSALLQLMTDAVARRLLDALRLPRANLLYAAGGNLLLLAPAGVEERLRAVRRAVSATLLGWTNGTLDQALAWTDLESAAIGRDVNDALGTVRRALAGAKRRPYGDVLADDADAYDRLFAPERKDAEVEPAEPIADYDDLAMELGQAGNGALFLHCHRGALSPGAPAWRRALHDLSGGWVYELRRESRLPGAPCDHLVDALNAPERAPHQATGFRFLATTTPRDSDGSVREFEKLGKVTPMGRIGVLRMDVDGLGGIFARELRPATLATISTLSASLDRFFAGWLNVLCREVERQRALPGDRAVDRADLLYTIYSGGDDLFVVGAWDLLPRLAERIAKDFARYCAENPALHVSAGIAIEDSHFPLYQLGERAADALDAAKSLRRPPEPAREKNALTLFGQVVPWEAYPAVWRLVERLTGLPREPSALLGRLRDLALLDLAERARHGLPPSEYSGGPATPIGRAHWRGLVALRRAAEQEDRKDEALRVLLGDLEEALLAGTLLPHLALVARWADFLWRPNGTREEG